MNPVFSKALSERIQTLLRPISDRVSRAKRLLWLASLTGWVAQRRKMDQLAMARKLAALADVDDEDGSSLVWPMRVSSTLWGDSNEACLIMLDLASSKWVTDDEARLQWACRKAPQVVEHTPKWLRYADTGVMVDDLLRVALPEGTQVFCTV